MRASVYTWATCVAVALSAGGKPDLIVTFLSALTTFLMFLAIYVFNDLTDLEVDAINAPNRPLALQSVTKTDALLLVLLLNFAGMAIGYWLGLVTFIITVAELLLGITYSVKPFNFKDRFLVKTLAIGAGGILASLYGGAATANSLNGSVIYAALLFLIFLFVTSPINDLADYVGDKAQGRRTIPIIIGQKNTVKLALAVSVVPLLSSLAVLPAVGLSRVTLVMFALLAARSIQLLAPLLKGYSSPQMVRSQHKRMVPLHFLLQASLAAGTVLAF
ncbi:MAG: UbiA family prenyltransferase [Thaumarchaeota archaeon]|nr:UbiA family prenyltransferase [Nitrososphaerota archaeon]